MIAPLVVFVWLLAAGAAQRLIPVAVGREGDGLKLQFSPEEVFADVGDLIQFQFYPVVCFRSLCGWWWWFGWLAG